MSLTKLISPLRYFQKDVITFLVVRRHDLNRTDDQIRYLALKPNSSMWTLRMKLWHLLELPDFCDEIIVLKTSENVEIPLKRLLRGNQPNRPYILEVWKPDSRIPASSVTFENCMLTMGNEEDHVGEVTSEYSCRDNTEKDRESSVAASCTTISENKLTLNDKLRMFDSTRDLMAEMKKSDLSSRVSNTSVTLTIKGKKSKDNFALMLSRIQNDLATLSHKLSSIENRIPN